MISILGIVLDIWNSTRYLKYFKNLKVLVGVDNKGDYFNQKHPPGGNEFKLTKNREEIQIEGNSIPVNLRIFSLSVMNFSLVFYFVCQHFCTISSCLKLKNLCHLQDVMKILTSAGRKKSKKLAYC